MNLFLVRWTTTISTARVYEYIYFLLNLKRHKQISSRMKQPRFCNRISLTLVLVFRCTYIPLSLLPSCFIWTTYAQCHQPLCSNYIVPHIFYCFCKATYWSTHDLITLGLYNNSGRHIVYHAIFSDSGLGGVSICLSYHVTIF